MFSLQQNTRDTAKIFAKETGGQAFYGNNDIRAALERAFDDDRYAYGLAFYPSYIESNGKFRKIKIQVARKDLQLRYRAGYYASSDPSDPHASLNAALAQAASSPLEATSLGMIVSGKPVQPLSARKLELHIGIDPKQLLLQISGNDRKGGVDLLLLQRDASGKTLSDEKQHIDLNFEEKQYEIHEQSRAGPRSAPHRDAATLGDPHRGSRCWLGSSGFGHGFSDDFLSDRSKSRNSAGLMTDSIK